MVGARPRVVSAVKDDVCLKDVFFELVFDIC